MRNLPSGTSLKSAFVFWIIFANLFCSSNNCFLSSIKIPPCHIVLISLLLCFDCRGFDCCGYECIPVFLLCHSYSDYYDYECIPDFRRFHSYPSHCNYECFSGFRRFHSYSGLGNYGCFSFFRCFHSYWLHYSCRGIRILSVFFMIWLVIMEKSTKCSDIENPRSRMTSGINILK